MKKLFDSSVDIQLRLFYVLAWTSCIANTIGFISNAVFYGLSNSTIICGICAVIMYVCGFYGMFSKSSVNAALVILYVINFFEFPFLYYVYGPGRAVYMLLGIVGIIVFLKDKWRVIISTIVVIYDVFVLIISVIKPCTVVYVTQKSDLGAAVISQVIVSISVIMIILLLILQYEHQTSELINLTEELKDMAHLDPLTKLYNRRYLTDYLDDLMLQSGAEFSVALLDIDDFKAVNDNYGHVYGDEVLQNFAEILKNNIAGMGIASRFGGEEFMLVFNTSDKTDIIRVMNNIGEELKKYSMSTKEIAITFSGGVETFHNEDRITKLFNAADEKLYTAKNTGKHRIVYE